MSKTNQEIASDLFNCAVDSKSRRVDWSEALGEDFEGWQAFEVVDCEECDRSCICSTGMGEDQHRYIDHEVVDENGEALEDEDGDVLENECMGTIYAIEGPMMNHFYPCELRSLSVEDAARAIAHLPLCVVQFKDGETGFALTGGGMDLSWEICDAFISCGYLPPLQYCDLPDMAGQEKRPRTQLILAACQRSAEIAEGWAKRRGESLARLADKYKDSAA